MVRTIWINDGCQHCFIYLSTGQTAIMCPSSSRTGVGSSCAKLIDDSDDDCCDEDADHDGNDEHWGWEDKMMAGAVVSVVMTTTLIGWP